MMKSKCIYVSYILVLLSCNTPKVKTLNYEIYNDIFPELVNSGQDFRTVITPSLEQLKEYEKTGVIPKRVITDKRKLLIVISDSIHPLQIEAGSKLLDDYKINTKKTVLNFKKIPYDSTKIALVRNREYDLNKERLNKQYYYSGHLAISSITLNKSLDEGYLTTSFICGKLCSVRTKIIIKKINNKWVISEYINLSIS